MATKEVPGVKNVEGNVPQKQVTVSFEAPATLEAIEKAMAEWGYEVAR
jgi:copper chaperone CopZ